VIVAPDARVEGQDATLERQRAVASEFLNDHVANEDVAVEKKVCGRLSNDR
jgi:hemerythrin